MDNNRRHIRSYNKVWKLENRIYAIQNVTLPIPIKPRELLYFFIIFFIMLILSSIFPFIRALPTILRQAIMPIALSQFLLKIKLDGKPPQKFFIAWLVYLAKRNEYIDRFCGHSKANNKKVKISGLCGYSLRSEKD